MPSACLNKNGNLPSPCAMSQLQNALKSARGASCQDSFLQVAMMSTIDGPQLLVLPMNSAASLGQTISSAFHTAHNAGTSAKQALPQARLSHPSNCNCQEWNYATDKNLQCQACDQQTIHPMTIMIKATQSMKLDFHGIVKMTVESRQSLTI
uniref:Uncharacterized protein n=1 Tax=Romanomermis culicivorax TaxID=13658 RepID=A0A915K8P2_ROMCU